MLSIPCQAMLADVMTCSSVSSKSMLAALQDHQAAHGSSLLESKFIRVPLCKALQSKSAASVQHDNVISF